jgi:DDE superfamily endonuclease
MAAALCDGVRGGGAQLAFHVTAGNYDTDTLIEVLSELRRFLGGEKATLLWDGLPAHRSRAMRAWLATQRSWLVVERLPAYAPELNPTEGCGPASRPSSCQSHFADPGRGDRPGSQGRRAGLPHPASGLLVPAPRRPVGLINHCPTPKALNPTAAVCGVVAGSGRVERQLGGGPARPARAAHWSGCRPAVTAAQPAVGGSRARSTPPARLKARRDPPGQRIQFGGSALNLGKGDGRSPSGHPASS